MKKLDVVTVNRLNSDIWAKLKEAIQTKNIALIESNLSRLHALQKEYIKHLNLQDSEITQLKDLLKQEEDIRNSFEKDWLLSVAKKTDQYDDLKKRIDETYKNI